MLDTCVEAGRKLATVSALPLFLLNVGRLFKRLPVKPFQSCAEIHSHLGLVTELQMVFHLIPVAEWGRAEAAVECEVSGKGRLWPLRGDHPQPLDPKHLGGLFCHATFGPLQFAFRVAMLGTFDCLWLAILRLGDDRSGHSFLFSWLFTICKLQSRIVCKECSPPKTIKVCLSCSWRCRGTTAYRTICDLLLCSSVSNAGGGVEGLRRAPCVI